MNIYTASVRLRQIEQLLYELDGEIPEGEEGDSLLQQLEINKENFKQSVVDYCQHRAILESEIKMGESEIERISKFVQIKNNIKSRIEEALRQAVIAFGEVDTKGKNPIYRFTTDVWRLGTRTTPSVELNMEELPDEFKRVAVQGLEYSEYVSLADTLGRELKVTIDALKTPIKEKLEAGEFIPGARIQSNISLSIK